MGLEVELEFPAHRGAETVEEFAKVHTANIVLHVTGIEMIRDIENDDAYPRLLIEVRDNETLQYRSVQRQVGRKARAVGGANVVKSIVHERVRKPRPNFQRRHHCDAMRRFQFAISKKPVRYVESQWSIDLVARHRRKVAEELVRGV